MMVYNILFCEQETVWLLHDKTRETVRNIKLQNLRFNAPGAGVLVLGRGHEVNM